MAWETRGGRARYYTRSQKVNGRVIRTYYGAGPVAEAAAAEDAARRARRAAQIELCRASAARYLAIDAVLDELIRLSDQLMRATLTAAGYHQHDRGAWRRRYNARETS